MDDLDHSVFIAEQDWDSFFQESEECDLRQGALAGLDDSGLSDFDEAEFCLTNQEVQPSLEFGLLGSQSSIDSPSDFEGPPVEPLESNKDFHGPEDSLCAGRNEDTVNVLFESTVNSGYDDDSAELNCAEQASADLSKDSSLDRPQEATEPAGACWAACGGDVYQEAARDCEDAIGSTSREPEIQMNAATTINLSAESVPEGVIIFHASNFTDNKSALSSLQASNECRYYRDHPEGEAYSVPKASQEGITMESEAGQSSLTRPSTSFVNPQKDSVNTEGQPDASVPARADHLNDHEKHPGKEKERWFVTVNVGQTSSREKTWPPTKKKRRKKSCSEDGPEPGAGSEGLDSDTQSNSGAERLGLSKPQSEEVDNNPDECRPAAEGSCTCESAGPTTSTITQGHKLKNDPGVLMLSREHLSPFQTTCDFEECKVKDKKSQHVDNHKEQENVSIRSNLQMNVALEGQLALKQQQDSSLPICTEESSWIEPSKAATAISPHPPNHQNLLVKLLFSTQSDTGCEILVFCKDSDSQNLTFSQEERVSQEDAETENQCKHCVQHSQIDDTPQKYPEHGLDSLESSFSIEYPEFSNGYVLDTIPDSLSLHRCLTEDQHVDLESKEFISVVPQITEVPVHNGLFLPEVSSGSGELEQSKDFVTPDRVQNDSKIQKQHACPDLQEVKKSNNELMHSEETSMKCLYGAEIVDAPEKYMTPERDSTLSASANTQPLTVSEVNSGLLTADQQFIGKKPHLEPATLHPVDTTVSNECSADISQNKSLVMMLRDSISHDPERNKDNLTDSLRLRTANMSKADSPENVSTQTFPEFLRSPIDPVKDEAQELDSKKTLAEDTPTTDLSAVDFPECYSESNIEDEPVLPREPVLHAGDLEDREPDPALDFPRPVYAISSFWDEMEKLTINDILHLRLVSNAQFPREFPQQQENVAADVSDAADSGYFAHPDDSKPDRWTGDASLLSDFEDEFQQTLGASANPTPDPLDAKSQVLRSPEPSGLWWEGEPNPTCVGPDNDATEIMTIPSEDSISQNPFSEATQNFRTMCKTATVQNLQTLEKEAQSYMSLPGEEESSILFSLQQRPVETCSLASLATEHGNDENSLPLPLLFGKASPENYAMSFPEMSKHFFAEDEAKTSLSGRDSSIACSQSETNLSDRASPILVSLPEPSLSERGSHIVVSLPEAGRSGKASPIVCSLSDTNLSDRASGIVCSMSETSLSGIPSPIVYSISETNLSDRASPIVVSLPEASLSGRASSIVYSPSETNLSDRASPIVCTMSETSLSGRPSPIICTMSETSLSGRPSPIVVSLPEASLSGRASSIVYSPSETNLSDRASPIVCTMSETSLSGRPSPIVCTMSETSLSGRPSPIVCTMSETSLSGRPSPIVYSLSETNLSDRASSIVVSLPEASLSGRASSVFYSPSETNLSDRASLIVRSMSETGLSGRPSPIVYSLSETNLSDRASPIVVSLPEASLSERDSPIVVSLPEASLSGRASSIVYSPSETNLSERATPVVCSMSEMSLSDRASPAIVSLYDRGPSYLSLPETYDYFFSDYDAENVFFPPIQRLGNHTDAGVPIFSCSHSVNREFRFVEEYDFVFPEGPPVESENEERHIPTHVVTSFDSQAHEPLDALVGADRYEHLFTDKDWRGNLFERNLLSLRRLRFTGGLFSSSDRSTSWAFAVTGWRERSSPFRIIGPGSTMEVRGTSHPHPNLYLEHQLCNELMEQRDTEMQAVVSYPKKAFLFTLKQSDICLVCIAFASWVLKSANPQSTDTWKTALLANVSAISAIQYLRRYMREDASENKR